MKVTYDKLEYGDIVTQMRDNGLPFLVWQCTWRQDGAARLECINSKQATKWVIGRREGWMKSFIPLAEFEVEGTIWRPILED